MSPEERAVYINSKVACAMIEAQGMTAENMQRKVLGKSMAFDAEHFSALIEEYGIGKDAVLARLEAKE